MDSPALGQLKKGNVIEVRAAHSILARGMRLSHCSTTVEIPCSCASIRYSCASLLLLEHAAPHCNAGGICRTALLLEHAALRYLPHAHSCNCCSSMWFYTATPP
jgi:hypothetical protein